MEIKDIIKSKEELYIINFDYNNYVFRLLTLGEFNRFNKLLTNRVIAPFFLYEEIFNLCTDYKYEYLSKNVVAGHAISTGNLIYYLSGDKEGKDFLFEIARKREELKPDSLYEHMKIIILTAFSSYTPKSILDMTEKEFIFNFVSAENKLAKTKEGFQRLDLKAIYDELYNPNPKKEENKKQDEVVHNVEKMEQEIGYWEVQEAEQRFLQEERQRLKAEYLKKLDERKG
jgi:uncharacterized small protein (DUF1192 family)